jgi:hypothetical protein
MALSAIAAKETGFEGIWGLILCSCFRLMLMPD